MITPDLLKRYSLISDQVEPRELTVILAQLEQILTADTDGAIVEFGCYIGTTSLFIARLLRSYQTANEFHVYDSFAGLPDKCSQDVSPAGEQFRVGELSISKQEFIRQFKKAGLPLPIIHKKWFHNLTPDDVPDNIIFAFLDGDYYESIRASFRLITPKLLANAVVIVDDYTNEALPGAARAANEWLLSHPAKLRVERSLAVIRYLG